MHRVVIHLEYRSVRTRGRSPRASINMYTNMTVLNHGKISILRVNSSNMVKVRGRDSVSQWESVGTMLK